MSLMSWTLLPWAPKFLWPGSTKLFDASTDPAEGASGSHWKLDEGGLEGLPVASSCGRHPGVLGRSLHDPDPWAEGTTTKKQATTTTTTTITTDLQEQCCDCLDNSKILPILGAPHPLFRSWLWPLSRMRSVTCLVGTFPIAIHFQWISNRSYDRTARALLGS